MAAMSEQKWFPVFQNKFKSQFTETKRFSLATVPLTYSGIYLIFFMLFLINFKAEHKPL